jgi:hypothetical protein
MAEGSTPIDKLDLRKGRGGLRTRVLEFARSEGMHFAEEFALIDRVSLLLEPNMGKRTVDALEVALRHHGIALSGSGIGQTQIKRLSVGG